jgi:predicted secreted protein
MKKIFLAALFLVFISAVSYSQVAATFTESDSQVSVNAGEWFDVKLESNKTTGYSWVLMITDSNPDGVVVEMGNEYINPETDLRGAPGHELWHFKTMQAGFFNLVFNYTRPWEKEGTSAKTVTIGVTVK